MRLDPSWFKVHWLGRGTHHADADGATGQVHLPLLLGLHLTAFVHRISWRKRLGRHVWCSLPDLGSAKGQVHAMREGYCNLVVKYTAYTGGSYNSTFGQSASLKDLRCPRHMGHERVIWYLHL